MRLTTLATAAVATTVAAVVVPPLLPRLVDTYCAVFGHNFRPYYLNTGDVVRTCVRCPVIEGNLLWSRHDSHL